tara:strand:+ start:26 stop:2134 length:2109 start_codon:yes stop_codon:yes gene_type:complete
MKNYYNTFILLLLLIVLIFIFVVTNLKKSDNFSDYYVEGCIKNTYGGSADKQCKLCKSCNNVIDTDGDMCNSSGNLCYRDGCTSSNPGVCKKLIDCSYPNTVDKYKFRVNGRKALDGDNGQQGTCSLISCPSNKYIDLEAISQEDKNALESGNLDQDYIHTHLCKEPPSCGEGLSRSGFIRANNGDLGSEGSCVDSWKLCTSTTQYWDDGTRTCTNQSDNTTCPANTFISVMGEPKTDSSPGTKIECSSCYKSCDNEVVTYYRYNFDQSGWSTHNVRCNNDEKCIRENCTTNNLGACKHATFYQYTHRDRGNGRPLNNTREATDSDYGTYGNFVNHPECIGDNYRIRTDWNQHNNKFANCNPFITCNGENQYLLGQQRAVGGPLPNFAFGSKGTCETCSSGKIYDGQCKRCDNNLEYHDDGECISCPTSYPNGVVDAFDSTVKSDISECPVNCNVGYSKNVSKGNKTTCIKCEINKYLNSQNECVNCTNVDFSTHDNDPDIGITNPNQCKIKCNVGYQLEDTGGTKTCIKCNNDQYYETSTNQNYGSKSGSCSNCDDVANSIHDNNSDDKTSNEECKIKCNEGYKFSQTGQGNANVKECIACNPGTYLQSAGLHQTCTQCQLGTYQNLPGKNKCNNVCSTGGLSNNNCHNYTNTLGATKMKTCSSRWGNYAITSVRDYIANGYTNPSINGGKATACRDDLTF